MPDTLQDTGPRRGQRDRTVASGPTYPRIAGEPADASRRQFARINALVDLDVLADLTMLEAKAWIVLFRHADADGLAYPCVATIARRIGTDNLGRVRAAILGRAATKRAPARPGLVGRGLVEVVKFGGGTSRSGRGISSTYRLLPPVAGARSDGVGAGTVSVPPQQGRSASPPRGTVGVEWGGRSAPIYRDAQRRPTGTLSVPRTAH